MILYETKCNFYCITRYMPIVYILNNKIIQTHSKNKFGNQLTQINQSAF